MLCYAESQTFNNLGHSGWQKRKNTQQKTHPLTSIHLLKIMHDTLMYKYSIYIYISWRLQTVLTTRRRALWMKAYWKAWVALDFWVAYAAECVWCEDSYALSWRSVSGATRRWNHTKEVSPWHHTHAFICSLSLCCAEARSASLCFMLAKKYVYIVTCQPLGILKTVRTTLLLLFILRAPIWRCVENLTRVVRYAQTVPAVSIWKSRFVTAPRFWLRAMVQHLKAISHECCVCNIYSMFNI